MASFFRKQPRPPRRWYQKTRYQLPMLLAGFMVIPFWYLASLASENLTKAPPVGSVYKLPHYNQLGYHFVTTPGGRNIWARYCIMAKGGTVTLTQHLLIRKDVGFLTVLSDLNESAVFVYQPPPEGIPHLVMRMPFCPPGLIQPVLINTFFPAIKRTGYDNWPKPAPTN